jgi:hypothetical protein
VSSLDASPSFLDGAACSSDISVSFAKGAASLLDTAPSFLDTMPSLLPQGPSFADRSVTFRDGTAPCVRRREAFSDPRSTS